jgi:protein-disulfide isomerase
MKSRARWILIVLAAAVAWGGCEGLAPDREATPPAVEPAQEIVASVDGVPISAEELDASAKAQLQKLIAQIYQTRRRVLDGMIEEMLIEKAAKEQGMSAEEFVKQNVDAKVTPPTDEEVKEFYEAQKARIKIPFEQMKERIAAHIKNTRTAEKRRELIASLKEKADVKILLEPPRTKITLDGAAFTVGEEGAGIVLVEFSDYQCPYSKKAQETVRRVLDEYKDKVHYAFFDYPLAFHKEAMKAHEAARCAGEQAQYDAYSKKLFENQKALAVEELKKYAADLGLDTEAFDSCLDNGKSAAKVQKSVEKGNLSGVSGTPAFFVNGIMISGAQPFEKFQEVVEAELSR